jgi:hypothetical protein
MSVSCTSVVPSVSSTRNLSSEFLQIRMDDSASVPFCKRGLRALYALANANCSAPLVDSSARNASARWFADLEVHHLQGGRYSSSTFCR